MLCRMMAPLTPFFAEYIYQNLKRALPGSAESVHFLMIPEANEAAIDPQIEADVKVMLQVEQREREKKMNTYTYMDMHPRVNPIYIHMHTFIYIYISG